MKASPVMLKDIYLEFLPTYRVGGGLHVRL